MKTNLHSIQNVLSAFALSLTITASIQAADGPPPRGWGGTPMNEYKRGSDPDVSHEGQPSVFIESVAGNASGFGTMTQGFVAADYLGKRVRFKGFVKTKDVTGTGAGLWLRIDDARNRPLQMDNMEKRSIKGSTDWTEVSIVVDVPQQSDSFLIGVLLVGKGRMWISGLSFEVVDATVPVTAKPIESAPRRKPMNLGFTE